MKDLYVLVTLAIVATTLSVAIGCSISSSYRARIKGIFNGDILVENANR